MKLKYFSTAFKIFLWSATFVVTLIWIFVKNPLFQPEPVTVLLGLISAATTWILYKYEDALNAEKFTTANALAYGYVNNFIEPVLTKLIKSNNGADSPIMYIFIPQKLSDITPACIDRIRASFKQEGWMDKTVTIKLDEGRGARDVMTVKNLNEKNVYLDFPNTLLTLNSMIEYKLKLPKNSFNEEGKKFLEKNCISAFKSTVQQLLTDKRLYPKNVKFTETCLNLYGS